MKDTMKRWLGGSRQPQPATPTEQPDIPWIPADQNPWGVPLLDVRPVTHHMTAASKDPRCASNAVSYGQDDGLGFLNQTPPGTTATPCDLTYRRDGLFADGPLFIPATMEHKWAIFHHGSRILCVRSWTRQVQLTAQVEQHDDVVAVREIAGGFSPDKETPDLTIRTFDYLLRSHVLDVDCPVPLPPGMEANPYQTALWCMSMFGNKAAVATPSTIVAPRPHKPIRAYSLLHIGVARGDGSAVHTQLARGVPVDLLANDGLTPLHWALNRPDSAMVELLLASGARVDGRSDQGATPLMTAVQATGNHLVDTLLKHGADPNAQDDRGFTALHRAAELGKTDLVRVLLSHGARSDIAAHGHTARSLAQQRGHASIVALLG
jgi:hypothetical protein